MEQTIEKSPITTLVRRTNEAASSIRKLFPTAKGMGGADRDDLLKSVSFIQSIVKEWRGLVENGADKTGFSL